MSSVENRPPVAGTLASPVKNQAAAIPAGTPVGTLASTPAAGTPVGTPVGTPASTPSALTPAAWKTIPDTFTPSNLLFADSLQLASAYKQKILEGASTHSITDPGKGIPPAGTPVGTPSGTPAATPAATPEAQKAASTLLTDNRFGIIAGSYDGNDTLSKEEAGKWLDTLKNSKDTSRGPFTGQAREDMINALTYVTSGDHFSELAANDSDKNTISKTELQMLSKPTGPTGVQDNYLPGSPAASTLSTGQQKVKDSLATLMYVTNGADIGTDNAVRNAVIRGGPTGGELGFTKQGVNNLALAKLDDENIWKDVPQDKRQAAQNAAKVLMNTDGNNSDAAQVFGAALAKEGGLEHMSLDEVKGYINNPSTLPTQEFDTAFPLSSRYPNIHIEKDSFSASELMALNDAFNFQANDPDGRILLDNLNKKYPNGFTIKKDAIAAGNAKAAAFVQEDILVLGGGFNPSDKAGVIGVLTHEITHAASAPVPAKGTNEALANVLSARLTYRYGGNTAFNVTNYGHATQFDGSAQAEAEIYKYTLLDTYKKDGAWPRSGYSYEGLPDFSYGDYLESLGFNFDFPFEIDLGPR